MKKTILFGLTALLFAACSNNNQVETTDAQEVAEAQETSLTLNVDTEASSVAWVGSKILGGKHNGTVAIAGGSLAIEGGMIVSGNFTIDMNSIVNEDLPAEGDYNQAKLVGHLKSDDFFNVEAYPTAKFEITAVNTAADEAGNTHVISGNLTIRDITKNITFPAKVEITESGVTAAASFVFNRLDWGVNWDKAKVQNALEKATSKVKDDFVKNEIELSINLVAKQ
jgi:polyisoprenoid-binding protein YceI